MPAKAVLLMAALALSAQEVPTSLTIFMAGDSTMANKPLIPAQPERGWGQLLALNFKPGVRVENFAKNGRSSKSFRDEGLWQQILDRVKPGDYVIIQFGHNDEKREDPKRYTEPFGSFKKNLEQSVREVRERKGNPVLATPIARRSFDAEGKLRDTHGEYPAAIRQVAAEQKVPLLELTRKSMELIQELGPERSKKMFMWVDAGEFKSLPEGRKDDTHLNAFGASRICDLAVEEMKAAVAEMTPALVR